MNNKKKRTYFIQAILFILTVICTTLVGAQLIVVKAFDVLTFPEFLTGLYYSVPFLGFLTVHEFGHYFTARYHRVKVTLPYYIPLFFGIGTMGAFIRIKEQIKSRKEFFDIGIAGPLAGFVVALGVLYYGFTHLPPQEYIFEVHPEYEQYGLDYADHVYDDENMIGFALGTNLIFEFFKHYVVEDPALIPNPYEMMHYPWLFAGFLATFFTALNLIPIGQLDGGHVLYGLIGYKKHKVVSSVLFVLFVGYAGIGIIEPGMPKESLMLYGPLYLGFLYLMFSRMSPQVSNVIVIVLSVLAAQILIAYFFPGVNGYPGWLLFAFIIGRMLGVYHPPALFDEPLDMKRKALGWLALLIFVLSFSPAPLVA